MEKKKRQCDVDCRQHELVLLNRTYHRYNIVHSFCPKYQRSPKPPLRTHPIFNNDRKDYTGGFIIGVDASVLCNQDMLQKQAFIKRVKTSQQNNRKLVFPKPKKEHTLCNVCGVRYQNYFAHIMSEQHKEKIKNNIANDYILELTQGFSHLHVYIPPDPTKQIDHKGEEKEGQTGRQKMKQNKGVVPQDVEPFVISSAEQDSSQDESESESESDSSEVKVVEHIVLDSDSVVEVDVKSKSEKAQQSKLKDKDKNERGASDQGKSNLTSKLTQDRTRTVEQHKDLLADGIPRQPNQTLIQKPHLLDFRPWQTVDKDVNKPNEPSASIKQEYETKIRHFLCKYMKPFTPSNQKRKLREAINGLVKDKMGGQNNLTEELRRQLKEQLKPQTTQFIQINEQTVQVKPAKPVVAPVQAFPSFHDPKTNTTMVFRYENSTTANKNSQNASNNNTTIPSLNASTVRQIGKSNRPYERPPPVPSKKIITDNYVEIKRPSVKAQNQKNNPFLVKEKKRQSELELIKQYEQKKALRKSRAEEVTEKATVVSPDKETTQKVALTQPVKSYKMEGLASMIMSSSLVQQQQLSPVTLPKFPTLSSTSDRTDFSLDKGEMHLGSPNVV